MSNEVALLSDNVVEGVLIDEPEREVWRFKHSIDVLTRRGYMWPCLAKVPFQCFRSAASSGIISDINVWGEKGFKEGEGDYEYSVLCGKIETCPHNFEIEHTDSEEDRTKALNHYWKLFWTFLLTGAAIRILSDFGGLFAGLSGDCVSGFSPIWFLAIGTAVIIQLVMIELTTRLLSSFTHEGRPISKMMTMPSGLDQYRVVTALGVLDLVGRFTRASFVGYAWKCGRGIDDILVESFGDGMMAMFQPVVAFLGIGGMAGLFFIVGPIVISGSYMAYCTTEVHRKLREFDVSVGGPMKLATMIDDFAAMASWANLTPIATVLNRCAVPLNLDEDDDIVRVWEHIKTGALMLAAKVIPDNIMQMELQARFLGIAWPVLDIGTKLNILLLAFLPAGIDTVLSGITLVQRNRVLSVGIGFFLLFFPLGCYARILACFLCDSSVLTLSSMSCLPPDMIHRGNITVILPPS
eukprot:TRINITY_DN45650_c0_g1_i1.p1 TRINITY_DN45650_c0_g1~~TRINITY_DN45650_c0_g1_i1.p1  ORF type:complete len:466 (-),score=58.18 TRINITY_DN45650_c0_g1_i1:79-1476(-)